MSDMRRAGRVVIETLLDSKGVMDGFKDVEQQAAGLASRIGGFLGRIAVPAAVTASATAFALAVAEGARAADIADTRTKVLHNTLRQLGKDATEADAAVLGLSRTFGVVPSQVQNAMSVLVRSGMELSEATTLLEQGAVAAKTLGHDAATGIEAVSTAVRIGTRASMHAVGVTRTLSTIYSEYAESIGKTTTELTEQERVQARIDAVNQATIGSMGQLATVTGDLETAQARMTREQERFSENIGRVAVPAMKQFQDLQLGLLRTVNDLSPAMFDLGVRVVGFGAALATAASMLRALTTAGLIATGPAGWILLGVTAVAALAAAFAGRGGDSLTAAVDEARRALAGGNKDSMVGALDAVADKLDGPMRDSIRSIIGDFDEMGEAGVEAARKALAELARIPLEAQRIKIFGLQTGFGESRVGGLLTQAGGAMGNMGLRSEISDALAAGDLQTAIGLLNDAAVALHDIGLGGRLGPLTEFIAEVGSIAAFEFAPTPAPPPPTPSPTDPDRAGGGAARRVVERTFEDVLADLDAAGTAAMRRAAFEGSAEAYQDAAASRVKLIDRAITELLSDPLYATVPKEIFEDLRVRRETAAREAQIEIEGTLGPFFSQYASYLDAELTRQVDSLTAARTYLQGGGDDPDLKARRDRAARRVMFADAQERFGTGSEGLAGTAAQARVGVSQTYAELEAIREQNRIMLLGIAQDTYDATKRAFAAGEASAAEVRAAWDAVLEVTAVDAFDGLADSANELARFVSNAEALEATLKRSNDAMARQELFDSAVERYGSGSTGLEGTTAASRLGGPDVMRNRQAAIDAAEDTVKGVVAAYHAGLVGVDEVQSAVDYLTTLTPMSVAGINDLTDGILYLERVATAAAAKLRSIQEFDESPGSSPDMPAFLTASQTAFGEGYQGFRPKTDNAEDLANAAKINKMNEDAAQHFKDTVISAGIGLAGTLANAIKTGDVGGIISGVAGAAGAIIGAIPGLGQAWGVVASLLPIVGGLVGGMVGGGGQEAERRRQREAQQSRSVPAVNINFNVQQTNNYNGGPRDTANELQYNRMLDMMLESFYTRVLDPRLTTLERAAGLGTA